MDIQELKATAYDILAQIQSLQNSHQQVNNKIIQASQRTAEPKIEPSIDQSTGELDKTKENI